MSYAPSWAYKFATFIMLLALAACKPAPPPAAQAGSSQAPATESGAAAPPASAAASAAVTAPATSAPVLSLAGYGDIRFGMTLAQVKAQRGLEPIAAPTDPYCSYVRFAAHPDLLFMVEQGRIVRADVRTVLQTEGQTAAAAPRVPNSWGSFIGDSLAQAQAAQPRAVQSPHKYDPQGYYLTLDSDDGKSAFVLEIGDNVVRDMHAGLKPAAEYVEGCS